MLIWRCHQLLSGFLTNDHVPRVSHHSCLSVNDKGDEVKIPEIVQRFPGIDLTNEEEPGIYELGDRLKMAVRLL